MPASGQEREHANENSITIESMVGAARQGLGKHRLNVFSNPAHAQAFDGLMQGSFGEAVGLAQGGERRRSLRLVGARNGAGLLPSGIIPHTAQALLPEGEESIVELSGSFQMGTHSLGLPGVHRKGQFQQERGVRMVGACVWLLAA
ncbi:hypothetical protein KSX_54770 [Ktedonospora formicarum]|uniref:Uncharacterized protein n=1 Tax=Ktedonospora formicarum TaxID=2778364 RepID=A0A8J3I8F5_9CHLR|nr:hypothetical protein KSX_54770 [Ktedonospora formicarum]